VDDSRFVRGYVCDLLETAGYSVTQADDGTAALRLLETEPFDVVVTDLNMPALDGFAVLERVKLRELAAEVVILTGSHARDIDAAIRALRLGAHDYLTKPLASPDQALVAVERALETKRQRQALLGAQRRYRQLLERFPIGIYRSRPDGELIEVNSALVEMLAYADVASLLKVNARALYADPADRQRWQERLARAGTLAHFEVLLQRRDGGTLPVEEYARVSVDDATGATVYDGCVVDISQRVARWRARGEGTLGAMAAQLDVVLGAASALVAPGAAAVDLRQVAETLRGAAEGLRRLVLVADQP
jgi:PAS domain S-box-containing protein